MPGGDQQFEKYLITPELARRHAVLHMHMGILTGRLGMITWRGANLGDWTLIYDPSGPPLFYDFPVLSPGHEQLGVVRASASRILGVPVPTVVVRAAPWDVGKATLHAQQYIVSDLSGTIIDSRPVCYAYPKLGIAVNWKDEKGRTKRTVIDIRDFSVVPEKVKPGMRGPGMWSVYDHIAEGSVPEAIAKFTAYDKIVDEVERQSRLDLTAILDQAAFQNLQITLAAFLSNSITKILRFCNHGLSHECYTLHAQECFNYCVPATAQMVMDFWRYHYPQEEIARAMNTGECNTFNGTEYAGEENGLESLTRGPSGVQLFDAQTDMSPTFAKIKKEIAANRPFDYSTKAHAYACVGYHEDTFLRVITTEQLACLCDPWGDVVSWENWASPLSDVEAFVYLKRL